MDKKTVSKKQTTIIGERDENELIRIRRTMICVYLSHRGSKDYLTGVYTTENYLQILRGNPTNPLKVFCLMSEDSIVNL